MVRQASYADRQRHERKFSENQQVLVHRDHNGACGADGRACAKLRHRWIGPFKVLQVLSPTTVKLELPSTIRVNPVFHVSVLKPYEVPVDEPHDELSEQPAAMEDLPPSPIIDQDGQERFIVEGSEAQVCSERILSFRLNGWAMKSLHGSLEIFCWTSLVLPFVPCKHISIILGV